MKWLSKFLRIVNYINLTRDNIKLYAAGKYANPSCTSIIEFEEDYLRVKYLKVLIYKLVQNKKVNMRIIINHIICLSNVFPGESLAKILFTEFEQDSWNILTTFLYFLHLMPDYVGHINEVDVCLSSMSIENNLLDTLERTI